MRSVIFLLLVIVLVATFVAAKPQKQPESNVVCIDVKKLMELLKKAKVTQKKRVFKNPPRRVHDDDEDESQTLGVRLSLCLAACDQLAGPLLQGPCKAKCNKLYV